VIPTRELLSFRFHYLKSFCRLFGLNHFFWVNLQDVLRFQKALRVLVAGDFEHNRSPCCKFFQVFQRARFA
jgi:hypothetical protein